MADRRIGASHAFKGLRLASLLGGLGVRIDWHKVYAAAYRELGEVRERERELRRRQREAGRLGGRKRWRKRKPVDAKALVAAVDRYLKANPHWGLTGAKEQVAHDFRVSVRKVEQARRDAK